jgi:integrase
MTFYWRCCKKAMGINQACKVCGRVRTTSNIWASISHGGKTKQINLHTYEYSEALELGGRAHAEMIRDSTYVRGRITVAQLADKFRVDIDAAHVTQAWKLEAGRTWSYVLAEYGAEGDAALLRRREHIMRLVLACAQRGQAGQTIRRHLMIVRRALKLIRIAPDIDWPTPRDCHYLRRVVTEAGIAQTGHRVDHETLQRFWAHLDGDAKRLHQFAILTGLRSSELARLDWSMIVQAPDGCETPWLIQLSASATKARKSRVVGLSVQGMQILGERKTCGLVFPPKQYNTIYRRKARALGLDAVPTLRSMRHTHASIAAGRISNVRSLQAAVGHGSLAMTERYVTASVGAIANVAAEVSAELTTIL